MKRKESIVIAGYRSWAKDIYDKARIEYPQYSWYLAKNPDELLDFYDIKNCKMVILAGWSWILPKDMVNKKLVVGFHPSDLPNYAGGSPIQNQVLDNITETKMSLFRLDEKIDHGEIFCKEFLDLSGGVDDIFSNMTQSCLSILGKLMEDYPDIKFTSQGRLGKRCRRLSPEDSKVNLENPPLTALGWYNFIRCRENPYPNAYLEDETGIT